jgi:hypothetical protein
MRKVSETELRELVAELDRVTIISGPSPSFMSVEQIDAPIAVFCWNCQRSLAEAYGTPCEGRENSF